MIRHLLAAVTAALILATGTNGCGPNGGAPTPPPSSAPNAAPPSAAPSAPVKVIYDVYFIVEVQSSAGRLLTRQVVITETAIQQDGNYAKRIDLITGEELPRGPIQYIRDTRVERGMTFGAGVVMGSIKAVYLGYSGEYLTCYVERNGEELPLSRDRFQIPDTATGRSGAEVKCVHLSV